MITFTRARVTAVYNILSSSLSSAWRWRSNASARGAPPICAAHAASSSVASPPPPPAAAAAPLPSQPVTTRHVRSSAGESSKKSKMKTSSNSSPFASKIVNTSALAKAAGSRSFDACERTSTAWWAPNSI